MERHDPGELSPAERLDAVAEILARGVSRVLTASAASAAVAESEETSDEAEPEAR